MIVKLNVIATPYHDQVHYYLTVDFFYVALFGLSFSFLKQYNNACKSIKPKLCSGQFFIEIRFKSTWIFIVHYAIRHIFALYFKLTKNEGIPAKVKIIRNP